MSLRAPPEGGDDDRDPKRYKVDAKVADDDDWPDWPTKHAPTPNVSLFEYIPRRSIASAELAKVKDASVALAFVRRYPSKIRQVIPRIKREHPYLYYECIVRDQRAIRECPANVLTAEWCTAIVHKFYGEWPYLPAKNFDYELVKYIAQREENIILHPIKKEYKTEELALICVRTNPRVFKNMPKKLRTEAVCIEFLRLVQNPHKAIELIPVKWRRNQTIKALIGQN